MPRNPTTGVFTRTSNSFSNPVQGTIIEDVDADLLFDDYDDGLSLAIANFKPPRIITAAGAVTVTSTDAVILMNKTVGAATAMALPAVSTRNGLPLVVKDFKMDASTNNITITPNGAETIDGLATLTLAADGASVKIYPSTTLTGWFSAP